MYELPLPPSFFFRPPLLVHDHCYASGVQVQGDMSHDSLDKCEQEKDITKDGRRCVLCTVEGDAESMVSTTSCPQVILSVAPSCLLILLFHNVLLLVL